MLEQRHHDDADLATLFRSDTLPDSDVLQHVESCDECQERLEELLAEGISSDEIGELLRDHDKSGPTQDATELTFLEDSDYPDSIGRFARFEIVEVLGRGGMGIVMRGFDPSLNRHSAIKVLAPEMAGSAAARERFSREARSAAAVVHPHVVPIHTVDEFNRLPFLVMPVVEGDNLQRRVDECGPLTVLETVRIAAQVAEGLAAAHAQGLIHRDIKPANILLEDGVERVQITDFGLARAADDASLTRSGVIAGTPQYMSPEQAHGDAVDFASDLFSLGSLMYFMLTGHSPFRAETTMGVLNRICNDAPRSLQAVRSDVPGWLEAIVAQLHMKQSSERQQSASELSLQLKECVSYLQHPGASESPQVITHYTTLKRKPEMTANDIAPTHRTSRILRWPALLIVLAVIGVGVIGWLIQSSMQQQREALRELQAVQQGRFIVYQEAFSPGGGSFGENIDGYETVNEFIEKFEREILSMHVPKGSYGKNWILVRRRGSLPIVNAQDNPLSLRQAGIEAGTVLFVERLEPRQPMEDTTDKGDDDA